jgi:hypothetical protein
MKFNNIIFSDVWFNDKLSAWIEHYSFAFFLVEMLRPKTFVELGTHTGGSYFAFCQTIKTLQIKTKAYAVDTWQGDEHSGIYGEDVFKQVNQTNQENFAHFSTLLKTTFDNAGQHFENGSIDLLHIDGLHTYEAGKHDFERWLPKMSDTAVMIFHDTAVKFEDFGVWKLMEELRQKYPYFEFEHGFGLGILCTGSKINQDFLNFVNSANANDDIKNLFSSIGRKNLLEYQQKQQTEQIRILTDNLDLLTLTIKLKDEVNNMLRQKNELQKQQSDTKIKSLENELFAHISTIENLENQIKIQEKLVPEISDSLLRKTTSPLHKLRTFLKLNYFKLLKQKRLIERSDLYDKQYYLQNNPDVKSSGMSAIKHYLLFGGFEGRKPSKKFDSAFYLQQNPDVKASGMNPLVHYILHGQKENRQIIPLLK